MRRIALILILGMIPADWAQAQPAALPRAKGPLTLCDFASAEAVRRWAGLTCEPVVVEGRPGMRFAFAKWERGTGERPGVRLRYDDGKGYPAKDWSHYAKIAFDVRIEGDKPADLGLELRDLADRTGCPIQQKIVPGQVVHVELLLADFQSRVKVANIEEMVFFAKKPPQVFAVTVADLCLLPGEKPPPVELDLAYPNYRGLIFPSVDRVTVTATPHLEEYSLRPEDLKLVVACGGDVPALERPLSPGETEAALPTTRIPPGPVKLTATVLGPDGAKVAGREWSLRRLTAAEARGLKVYIDQNNNAVVDGKPFFPLGYYGSGKEEHIAEIADSPFNCILDYGTNRKPKAQMLKYLDILQRSGLKLIYCMNDVYPSAKHLAKKGWEGIKGNEAIADAVIRAYRDHPALLAWYLNDERPRRLVPELLRYYQGIRDADPNHPCYIVLCEMADLPYFRETTDVMGVDPYPVPLIPVAHVSDWTDKAVRAVRGRMPVWVVPQAFGWYQCFPPGVDRTRIPTATELLTGRAPTYEESRCMTYLALTHGAKGLIYWCYYNMRVLPQYQEMWAGMKRIGKEVKMLSPVLLSPEDRGTVRVIPDFVPIHTKLKRYEGREYLIAVNGCANSCEVAFDLGHSLLAQAKVLFEDRSAVTNGSRLRASFLPFEVHVYEFESPAAK